MQIDGSENNTTLICFCVQVSSGQSSLLGDPPKEVRLPSNPYLNLASVMPGVVLQGEHTNIVLKEGMHLYLLQLYVQSAVLGEL